MHALCDTCKAGSYQNDAGSVCPLDHERFQEEECGKVLLNVEKIHSFKAYCWNQSQGCPFSGTLPEVLRHYEDECSFHTVLCPRCGESVLHANLVAHYSLGCPVNVTAVPLDEEARLDDAVFGVRDVSAALEEFKALLREPYREQLPALQSHMNHLSEQVANQHALLRRIDEMLLETSADEETWDRRSRMPWHLEQRHILRRLDVLASESVAGLQDLRRAFVPTVGDPIIWFDYSTRKDWTGSSSGAGLHWRACKHDGRERAVYNFVGKKMKAISNRSLGKRIVVAEVTQWHCKDLYFTMALITDTEKDRLKISFRLGGTLGSAEARSQVSSVCIEDESKRRVVLSLTTAAELSHDDLEWHYTFWTGLSQLTKSGFCKDALLRLAVTIVV
ncbi:hypothetical protein V5799_010213 [Amblyomma americanum]|uniref:Tnf receptor-associated factor n=1 Tax=Amblyomma americanum TaxID=6943 RepID=A0AAQ4F9A0_AMBAM